MTSSTTHDFDIVVVGAGHAGCEAALAAARMGADTALLTMNPDSVAHMSCNPAIGGVAKGQLVREIDALGGEMGKVIDATGLQFRMINTSKGPAMHSPRAQADKDDYKREMRARIEAQENLSLIQDLVEDLFVSGGRINGVGCRSGKQFRCGALVLATGTFLGAVLYRGRWRSEGGRIGEISARKLSSGLEEAGIELGRFRTKTPPRVDGRTIAFGRMEAQYGDPVPRPFSFSTASLDGEQAPCYRTSTVQRTHEVIRKGLGDLPAETAKTVGSPRYCPSIETKVLRFADKESHPLFIEPEGRNTVQYYCNGLFTCLSAEVQDEMIRTVPGLENAEIMLYGYGVEYDYARPHQLWPSLESKKVGGLFLAGQVNGTSGYEEAAAQGIMAGINAARKLNDLPALVLERDEAYIGVLIDDLVTKGTEEPYRMFTSLAEYRLLLRQDNADRRLMKYGYENGLVDPGRWSALERKEEKIGQLWAHLESHRLNGSTLAKMLSRPETELKDLVEAFPELRRFAVDEEVCEQVEIEARYAGYFERQRRQVEKFKRSEQIKIPRWLDYDSIPELRTEAKEKLSGVRPLSLGQASRISGISPADITLLMLYIEGRKRGG